MNEKETKREVSMPHDRGYKRSLSNPKVFLHFIKNMWEPLGCWSLRKAN